jgi:hypothetical protein
MLTCTFSFDVEKAPYNLQLELNDVQVIKNREKNIILWIVQTHLECYVVTNTAISKTFCIYINCEQIFSVMRFKSMDAKCALGCSFANFLSKFAPSIGNLLSNYKQNHLLY